MQMESDGRFHPRSTMDEDMSLQKMACAVLNANIVKSLKQTEQKRSEVDNDIGAIILLKSQMNGMLSDNERYSKRVVRDCFMSILQYDKLFTKSNRKTETEKEEHRSQLNEERLKLVQL